MAINLQPCRFCFDDEKAFDGFTDGTRWNGFLNVWATPATHEAIKAHFADDAETLASMIEDESSRFADGLYCYSHGYATYEVEEVGSDTESGLCDELDAFQKAQGLASMCAMEQLSEDVTPAQRAWLSFFVNRWERLMRSLHPRTMA
jgi:hypothetical protein